MKLPDPLRALCAEIVRRHLASEMELFEVAADELVDGAGHAAIMLPQDGGDAEFGSSGGADLGFVLLWRSLLEMANARPDADTKQLLQAWTHAMHQQGLAPELAAAIVTEFGDRLVSSLGRSS